MIPDYLFKKPLKIINDFTDKYDYEITGKILEIGGLKSYINKIHKEIFYYEVKLEIVSPIDLSVTSVTGKLWKKTMEIFNNNIHAGTITKVSIRKLDIGTNNYPLLEFSIKGLYVTNPSLDSLFNEEKNISELTIDIFDEYKRWGSKTTTLQP